MTSRTRAEAFLPLTPPMLHTLVALADGDKHGYAIIKEIARRTEDAVRLSAGTLYALIRRAEADGLIVEVHPCPEKAVSDGAQSLTLENFAEMMVGLQPYVELWKKDRP